MSFIQVPVSSPRFLSIDGGTATVGLCYFSVKDHRMIVHYHKLLDVTKEQHEEFEYITIRHGSLTARLYHLEQLFDEYLTMLPHKPQLVFYESHFLNPRRPNSVIPLARFMQVIERVLIKHGIAISYIAPQQMKRTIGVTGKLAKADKEAVKKAIRRLKVSGEINLNEDPLQLSEHVVDAIGIGYAGLVSEKYINLW